MAKKQDIEVYTPYNVLDELNIRYGSKKDEKIPCPRCGNRTFFMNMQTGLGHCFRAACDFRANHTSYFAAHMNMDIEDAREKLYTMMGEPYKKKGATSYTAPKPQQKKERKEVKFEDEAEIVSIDVRDAVYKEVVKSHPFIDRHVEDMIKRGLTKEEALSLGYCSYGYSDEVALAEQYLKKGYELVGVPGFYRNDNGQMQLRELKKGILIPFKDSYGRIQGFQLRKNNEELKKFKDNGKWKTENKCNWLSSSGLKDGSHIPAYSHYACNFVYHFNKDRVIPVIKDNKITITEGGMKGDIVHLLTGMSVLALPGVNALKEFEKELPFLKELGVETIEDAFDMDYLSNENVQKARNTLKELIEKYGFTYKLVTWETKAENHADLKGLDDYYAYHLRNV